MSEDIKNNIIQHEEPKKKRAKIMSACTECRRKKTKCDGEQPCYNCNKSKSTCIYSSHNLNNTSSIQTDKRNLNVVSKQSLEAIEMRLIAIEDMLRTILEQINQSNSMPFLLNNDNRLPPILNNNTNFHQHIPYKQSSEENQSDTIYKNEIDSLQINTYQPIKKRKR